MDARSMIKKKITTTWKRCRFRDRTISQHDRQRAFSTWPENRLSYDTHTIKVAAAVTVMCVFYRVSACTHIIIITIIIIRLRATVPLLWFHYASAPPVSRESCCCRVTATVDDDKSPNREHAHIKKNKIIK